jgi:hypothetical protein
VRRCAAFQLQELFSEPALPRWREKFDAGEALLETTVELAHAGELEDIARLRPQISNPRARIRAAALRGLWRLGSTDATALLEAAMRDEAPSVVAEAISIYEKGENTLARSTLESALSAASSRKLEAMLLTASRILPKWERLSFLLGHYQSGDPGWMGMIERELHRWLAMANRTFTRPEKGELHNIRELVGKLGRGNPSPLIAQISYHC